jgi:hypothetical protein
MNIIDYIKITENRIRFLNDQKLILSSVGNLELLSKVEEDIFASEIVLQQLKTLV